MPQHDRGLLTSVVVVSPYEDDHYKLGRLLGSPEWRVRHALTWSEAQRLMHREQPMVVVLDSDVPDRDWREILSTNADQDRPHLVISSSHADDELWSEVLNLGGYNVLAKPFDSREVEWVMRNATSESVLAFG